MSDGDFEFRDDPVRVKASSGAPIMLCPLKWHAEKLCNDFIRERADAGDSKARHLRDLLDQVGITPDFTPSSGSYDSTKIEDVGPFQPSKASTNFL